MGVSGNSIAGKSFQSFAVSEELLAKVVEATKAGEKKARSSGDIQSFEIFYRGFRMNISIGRLYVIPPAVANNKGDKRFPTALLYGTLVKTFGNGEEMADMVEQRIGDTEFDEYSQADYDTIKEKLFPEDECLILFAPNWLNKREYITFHYSDDQEALKNRLRHLVFSAYYNPAVSSAFDACMTNVDTTKVDVTDITPKLSYPEITESPLKFFPNLEKVAGNKKRIALTVKTADEVTKEVLDPQELDVFESLDSALSEALMPGTKSVEDAGEGGYTTPMDGGVPRVAKADDRSIDPKKAPKTPSKEEKAKFEEAQKKEACGAAHEAPFTNVGPGTEAAAEQEGMVKAVKEHVEKVDGEPPIGIAIDETGVPRREDAKTSAKKEAKRMHFTPLVDTQRMTGATGADGHPDLSASASAALDGARNNDKKAIEAHSDTMREYAASMSQDNQTHHAMFDHKAEIDAGKWGPNPMSISSSLKKASYIADQIALEIEDNSEVASPKTKKASAAREAHLDKLRNKQAVALDIDSIWAEITEDMGPAPLVDVDSSAPSQNSEGESDKSDRPSDGRPRKSDVGELPEAMRSDEPEDAKSISDSEAESQETELENSATKSEESHEEESKEASEEWHVDAKYADFVEEELMDEGDEPSEEALLAAQEAIDNDDEIIYDVAANLGQIVDNVKHMSWFVEAVAREMGEPGASQDRYIVDAEKEAAAPSVMSPMDAQNVVPNENWQCQNCGHEGGLGMDGNCEACGSKAVYPVMQAPGAHKAPGSVREKKNLMSSKKKADTRDNPFNMQDGNGAPENAKNTSVADTTGPTPVNTKQANDVSSDVSEAKSEVVSPDTVDPDIHQETKSVPEAAKVSADVNGDMSEAKSELDGGAKADLADSSKATDTVSVPEAAKVADDERTDGVPVAQGDTESGEQPKSDLSGPAPEASDLPAQLASCKPESQKFDFGFDSLIALVTEEDSEEK